MRNLDLIGPNIKLLFNGQEIYSTIQGGITTLFLAICSVLIFIVFTIDIIQKEKPRTVVSNDYDTFPVIEGSDIRIAIAPLNYNFLPFPDLENKFQLFLLYGQTNGSSTTSDFIELVKCSETQFFINNELNVTDQLMLSVDNYRCLPDNLNKSIYGIDRASFSSSFQLVLSPCDSQMIENNASCVTRDDLNNEIGTAFFAHFLFKDYFAKSSDFDAPIQALLNSDLISLTSSQIFSFNYYLNRIEFNSDEGVIMQSIHTQTKYQLNNIRSKIFNHAKPDYFGVFSFNTFRLKYIYLRQYIKLQEGLANTGGVIKILFSFITIAHVYLVNFDFIYAMEKRLYKKNIVKHGLIKIINEDFKPINVSVFKNDRMDNKLKMQNAKKQGTLRHHEVRNEENYDCSSIVQNLQNKRNSEIMPIKLPNLTLSKVKKVNFFDKLFFFITHKKNKSLSHFEEVRNKIKKKLDIFNFIELSDILHHQSDAGNKAILNEISQVNNVSPNIGTHKGFLSEISHMPHPSPATHNGPLKILS